MEKNIIQLSFSGIATVLSFLFGGFDIALIVLCIFLVIDYITGLMKSWKKGTLNSNVGLWGILKKIGYLTLVVVSACIDKLMGDTGAIRTLVIYFFVANEGISILENCGEFGVPLPDILMQKLEQLKGGKKDD